VGGAARRCTTGERKEHRGKGLLEMVYTGHLNRVPYKADDENSQLYYCTRMVGPLAIYMFVFMSILLNLPHDLEWDLSHLLWPIIPAIFVGAGGFFWVVWIMFGADFKERMEKKAQ